MIITRSRGQPHRNWSDTSLLFKDRTLFGLKTSQTMLILMYVFLIMMLIAPTVAPYFGVAGILAAVIGFSASIIEEAKKRKRNA